MHAKIRRSGPWGFGRPAPSPTEYIDAIFSASVSSTTSTVRKARGIILGSVAPELDGSIWYRRYKFVRKTATPMLRSVRGPPDLMCNKAEKKLSTSPIRVFCKGSAITVVGGFDDVPTTTSDNIALVPCWPPPPNWSDSDLSYYNDSHSTDDSSIDSDCYFTDDSSDGSDSDCKAEPWPSLPQITPCHFASLQPQEPTTFPALHAPLDDSARTMGGNALSQHCAEEGMHTEDPACAIARCQEVNWRMEMSWFYGCCF